MKRYPSSPSLFLGFLLVFILMSGCSGVSSKEEPTPTPLPAVAALANPTYTVQRGEVIELLRFNGRIAPVNEMQLYFRINGRVRNIYVKEGEPIKTGQVIADLEGIDNLQQQVLLKQLNVKRMQINANIAQLKYDIFIDSTPSSSKDYTKQVAIQQGELELANIAVQEATLGLQEIQDAVSDTQLLAPVDGTLISLGMSEGAEVQAFKPVGVAADTAQLEVSADVASDITAKLAVGMEATVNPQTGIGAEVGGSIRRMPFDSRSTGGGEDRTVRITLKGSAIENEYSLGSLVKVTVILQRKEDVLWLPPQAIRTFDNRQFVVVQEGNVQRRMDVKLGILGEDRVEIQEGVTEGQVVVSP